MPNYQACGDGRDFYIFYNNGGLIDSQTANKQWHFQDKPKSNVIVQPERNRCTYVNDSKPIPYANMLLPKINKNTYLSAYKESFRDGYGLIPSPRKKLDASAVRALARAQSLKSIALTGNKEDGEETPKEQIKQSEALVQGKTLSDKQKWKELFHQVSFTERILRAKKDSQATNSKSAPIMAKAPLNRTLLPSLDTKKMPSGGLVSNDAIAQLSVVPISFGPNIGKVLKGTNIPQEQKIALNKLQYEQEQQRIMAEIEKLQALTAKK